MADPYPYRRHGMVDTPTAMGGGVAFRPSAPPGSMQGMPTQQARSYLEFLALQKKKREEEALRGLLGQARLGTPDDGPIGLLNESANTGKVDHILNAALRNLGETLMPSAQAAGPASAETSLLNQGPIPQGTAGVGDEQIEWKWVFNPYEQAEVRVPANWTDEQIAASFEAAQTEPAAVQDQGRGTQNWTDWVSDRIATEGDAGGHTDWVAEGMGAESDAPVDERIPDGAGMDHWPQPPNYSSRHGLTDTAVRGLLADAARSGRSIERADDPQGAAQAVDDFGSYPEVPARSFGQGLSDALFAPSEPTQTGGSGPFQNYAETMIGQEADRVATQEARQDVTGEVLAPIRDVVLPDVALEAQITEQKKLNVAEDIKDQAGAENLTGQEVAVLADADEQASDGNPAALQQAAEDTSWSPRETFPRNVAQKRKRYLDALNDIFTKAMILNVVAEMTGTESNAEFFVKMALAKMDAVQKFDGQERLENLSQVIFFDGDGNYSPPASKQDAYNRARRAKASQTEAEHLSGHFGSSERTSPEKNHLKTLSLKKAWDQALKEHGEGSPEANMAELSLDIFQTLSKQRTGQLTAQNIITARKGTFEKLFGKSVQGKWKLPGNTRIHVPPTIWSHWINGTVPPPSETRGAAWTMGKGKNAGIYTVKMGTQSYQIPTWDVISQSVLLKDVQAINQSISIEDGKPEEEVGGLTKEQKWVEDGSIVVDSQLKFDALESDTLFKDPEGKIKVKP
jgi:hypothetical protein